MTIFLEIPESELPGALGAYLGLYRESFTFCRLFVGVNVVFEDFINNKDTYFKFESAGNFLWQIHIQFNWLSIR